MLDNSNCLVLEQLHPTSNLAQLQSVCQLATQLNTSAITLPPMLVKFARQYLGNNPLPIRAAIGYPYGYAAVEAKVAETVLAMVDGASGIEVTTNHLAMANNDWQYLAHELNHLLTLVTKKQIPLGIRIQTDYLQEGDLLKCCDLYGAAGIGWITLACNEASDDFNSNIVQKARLHLSDQTGIQVSGLIKNATFAQSILSNGASLLGVSADTTWLQTS